MDRTVPPPLSMQDVAALKRRKAREETGCILVEGRHPIEEALCANLTLRAAFIRSGAPADSLPRTERPFPARMVDEKAMARLSDTHSAPPCLAVFERPAPPRSLSGSLALVLDEIQDPGNLGTLIRSAVAFGVDSILILGDAAEVYSPKVIRSSAGLVFARPVLPASFDHFQSTLCSADDGAPWRLFATTVDDGPAREALPPVQSYRHADYGERCAIILGNEGRGVAPEIRNTPDLNWITIPMNDRVESLNVAVSGSIILAEIAAQRAGKPEGVS